MIRLNLLPQYVIEFRRIRALIVIFVVILLVEGGIVFKAYTDLQAQSNWFNKDKDYFVQRKQKIDGEVQLAGDLQSQSTKYEPYLTFFKRDSVTAYNQKIVDSLTEAGKMVSGGHGWFTNMTITKGNVTYKGHIKGLMNFLEFYFLMEDAKFDVTPAAQPASAPDKPMLSQEIDLNVSGALKTPLPDKPTLPDTPKSQADLYIPDNSKGAAAGPGAAPGGPKGAAGGPGGAKSGNPSVPGGAAPGAARGAKKPGP